MSEWSHLPNAKHIDWVLQSVKDNPDTWVKAWDSALNAARVALWNTTRDALWNTALNAARDAALNAVRYEVWDAARCALRALVAYDDCEKYLNISYDQLLLWSELDPHPACILLLPYVYVTERIMGIEKHFGVEE